MAVALLGVAGWVDAVGFLHFRHVFVSFMSGNTTLMAVSLGTEAWGDAGTILLLLGLFVLGVFAGTLFAAWLGRWRFPAILGIEALLLGTSLFLPVPVAAFPVVLAMGWQNASLQQVGKKKLGLTYVTGTLVALGRGLADAVRGVGAPGPGWTICSSGRRWRRAPSAARRVLHGSAFRRWLSLRSR